MNRRRNKTNHHAIKIRPLIKHGASFTFLVLKTICEVGFITIDSFFPAKYPESRFARKVMGVDGASELSKPTLYTILWRLQKEGLIEKKKNRWLPSLLGKKLIKNTWFKKVSAPAKKDGLMRIVIFDIPEKERHKRVWLRVELMSCGYEILQKSVWIGYRPLPPEFLEALEELNLRSSVHIFSVKHKGTLKKE